MPSGQMVRLKYGRIQPGLTVRQTIQQMKRESVLRSETRQGHTGGSNAFVIFGVFNLFAWSRFYLVDKWKSLKNLVGDVSKAHRRFLHAPEERGLLSCRICDDDIYVYVNRVGTFGLSCASYCWARIAGAGIRLMHEMLGPQMPVELLIFADDLEAIASSAGGRRGIT